MRFAVILILVPWASVHEVASVPKGHLQDHFQFPPMELNDSLGKTPKDPGGVHSRKSSSTPCPKFPFSAKTFSSSTSPYHTTDSNEEEMLIGDQQKGMVTSNMPFSKTEAFNYFLENPEHEGSPEGHMYVHLKANGLKPPSGKIILGDKDRTYPKKRKNEILRAWTKRPIPDHKMGNEVRGRMQTGILHYLKNGTTRIELLIPGEEVGRGHFSFKPRTAFLDQASEQFRASAGLVKRKESDSRNGKYGVKITRFSDSKNGNKSKIEYKLEGGLIQLSDNGKISFEKIHPIMKVPSKPHTHIEPRYKMLKWEERESSPNYLLTNRNEFREYHGPQIKRPGKIIKYRGRSKLIEKDRVLKILAGDKHLNKSNQRKHVPKFIVDYEPQPKVTKFFEPSHKDIHEFRKHGVGRIMFLDLVQGIEIQTQPPHEVGSIFSAKEKDDTEGSNSKTRVGRISYDYTKLPTELKQPNVEHAFQPFPYPFLNENSSIAQSSTEVPFPEPIPEEHKIQSPPWQLYPPYIGIPST